MVVSLEPGKTTVIWLAIILGMIRDYHKGNITHALCFRRVANTLRRTTWNHLLEVLEFMGLMSVVTLNTTLLTVTFNSGQTIQLIGLEKGTSVKGIKFKKGWAKYNFFEELDDFEGFEEIDIAMDSLIRSDMESAFKQIDREFMFVFAYNPPKDKNRWINEHYDNLPDNVFKLHTTYEDIIHWLPKATIARVLETKELNFKDYQWRYLGISTGTDGLVYHMFDYKKHVTTELDPGEKILDVYVGCDEGTMRDATTLIPLAITTKERIVCLPTYYYDPTAPNNEPLAPTQQIELMTEYLISLSNKYKFYLSDMMIIIDSAASALYKQIQLDTDFVIKKVGRKDVLEDARLVQDLLCIPDLDFKIIDDGYYNPRTKEKIKGKDMLIHEMEYLKYDDKGRPEDKNNHSIDALKYAVKELVARRIY